MGHGVILALLLLLGWGGGHWFIHNGTIQGVPTTIILKFLTDEVARDAYFSDHKDLLHQRLNELGIEEEIKDFYRPTIPDEAELDQYIHQLLYDRTGYVGRSYKVVNQQLVLKTRLDQSFPRWFSLAYQAGIVVGSKEDNGHWIVITPDGEWIPYPAMATLYPPKTLRRMIRQKSRSDL
ncbi:hypothetical protein [Lyngbya confervoides]|uniref:Uncharacterized protein n=1 Tax=Lyngbya confervoides BDU141951 TaxID=1574623 RepID=A0ABD4T1K8_9CYAN|nr:hypothetical protein [Lyngbya confervoides]MCM1982533.1 hypothetical protein [Lyngbya confervoides BDU141951]